jgi:hypothetical protein
VRPCLSLIRGKSMLELMSYGLSGLAAMVVIAYCFADGEEFSLVLDERSLDLMDEARWLLSRQSEERTASAVYSGTPSKSLRGEAFHG